MEEKAQNESSLFAESLKNHQKLVNILVDARGEDNISRISQPEMARLIGHSQTWVAQAIKRLNTEDMCIEIDCSRTIHCLLHRYFGSRRILRNYETYYKS